LIKVDDMASAVIDALDGNGLVKFALPESAIRVQIDRPEKSARAGDATHNDWISCIEPVKSSIGVESGHKTSRPVATAAIALNRRVVREQTYPGVSRLIGKYTRRSRHDDAVALIFAGQMTLIQPPVRMKVYEALLAGPAINNRIPSQLTHY
jgi:hypothetical protein